VTTWVLLDALYPVCMAKGLVFPPAAPVRVQLTEGMRAAGLSKRERRLLGEAALQARGWGSMLRWGVSASMHCGLVKDRWATVMLDPKGTGDKAPQEGGGKGKSIGHSWRPSSPKAKVPRLPCPRPQGVGRGEGSMEMKEGLHA